MDPKWGASYAAMPRRPRKMCKLRTIRIARRDFITRIKRNKITPSMELHPRLDLQKTNWTNETEDIRIRNDVISTRHG